MFSMKKLTFAIVILLLLTQCTVYKKPNWFRRTAVRLLFDWKWIDINL
jgi:hypothetical protein